MSRNLLTLIAGMSPYEASVYSQPVGICTPATLTPHVVRATIDWTNYGASSAKPDVAVLINIQNQQVQTPLDKIRSIKIDNTFCDTPVYVQFTDTLDTFVCPANTIVIAPVYTNVLEAIIYGEGFFDGKSPKTTVEFANFDRQGLIMPGEFADRVNHQFVGFGEQTGVAASYNFGAFNLKMPPSAGRVVVIAYTVLWNGAGSFTFSSLTLNGFATVAIQQSTAFAAAGQAGISGIRYAVLPAGTTVTPVLTFNSALRYGTIGMWSLDQLNQLSPLASALDSGTISDAMRVALMPVVPGTFGMFCQTRLTATPGIPVWKDGVTINGVAIDNTLSVEVSYASQLFDVADNVSTYAIGNSIAGAVFI